MHQKARAGSCEGAAHPASAYSDVCPAPSGRWELALKAARLIMTNIEEIERAARVFRCAFEGADLSDAPGSLPRFPEGCCSWATWMLGHYLRVEVGFDVRSVQGTRSGGECSDSHEWLLVNGFTVDITADQFPDNAHGVIVEEVSAWHSTWVGGDPQPLPSPEDWDRGQSPPLPTEIYERLARKVRAAEK